MKTIVIVSGEGSSGSVEQMQEGCTHRALRRRLMQERCGGDRWTYVLEFGGTNEWGSWGYDVETGAPRTWPAVAAKPDAL
jgi:hypothetical protein